MVDDAIDCVVEEAVTNVSFVDDAGFGVRDMEYVVGGVAVCFIYQVRVEC